MPRKSPRHERESELVVVKAAEALGILVKLDNTLSTDMVDDSISAAIGALPRGPQINIPNHIPA